MYRTTSSRQGRPLLALLRRVLASALTTLTSQAHAVTGLAHTVDAAAAQPGGDNAGFATLGPVAYAAMLIGAVLWAWRFAAARRDESIRSEPRLAISAALLGFFGAAAFWLHASSARPVDDLFSPTVLAALTLMPTFLLALFMALRAAPDAHRWSPLKTMAPFATSLWLAGLTALIAVPLAGALSFVWQQGSGPSADWLAGVSQLLVPRYWSLNCLTATGVCGSAVNSIGLGLTVAVAASLLGLLLALFVHSAAPGMRRLMAPLVCLPMLTPPFLIGLGLAQLFGQAGAVSLLLETGLGVARSRWFFGFPGLAMTQVLAFFPVTYFLALGALDSISRAQIDAARFLGASDAVVLRSITFPAVRESLLVGLLLVFVESLPEIGNPLVIGGRLRVLATELFYSGSTELSTGVMTGVPAVLLALIALAMAVLRERIRVGRWRTDAAFAGSEHASGALPAVLRQAAGAVLLATMTLLLAAYATIGVGAFSAGGLPSGAWSLENFSRGFGFSVAADGLRLTGTGWDSLLASLACAVVVAPLSAFAGMSMVWILQRGRLAGSALVERLSGYLLSVPSLVIGAGFLLAFGHLGLSTGGAWLLITLAMAIRNLAACMRFGSVALRRLDPALDELSGLFGAGVFQTFSRIVAPLLGSTFFACVAYGFVRSMTMLGSVLLLSSVDNQVATTYMIDRIGVGEYGVSMAYGVILASTIGSVLATAWLFGKYRRPTHRPLPTAQLIGDFAAALVPAAPTPAPSARPRHASRGAPR